MQATQPHHAPLAIDLATLKRPLVYDVIVNTGNTLCGGTDSKVVLQLHGTMEGKMISSSEIELHSHAESCFAFDPKARHLHDKFERGNSDRFSLECTTQLHVVFEVFSLASEVLGLCFSLIFLHCRFLITCEDIGQLLSITGTPATKHLHLRNLSCCQPIDSLIF